MIDAQIKTELIPSERCVVTVEGEDLYHLLYVLRMREDGDTNPHKNEAGIPVGGYLYDAILNSFGDSQVRVKVVHDMRNWAERKGLRE